MKRNLMMLMGLPLVLGCGSPDKDDDDDDWGASTADGWGGDDGTASGGTGGTGNGTGTSSDDTEDTAETADTEDTSSDEADDVGPDGEPDTEAYEGDEPGECADEADNDRDGLWDCEDPGCIGSPACSGSDSEADADADADAEEEVVDDCDICAPIIDVSDDSLSIDALLACEASETITVRNIGDRPLRITGTSIINDTLFTCGTFSTPPLGGPVVLGEMESHSITVTYRATRECAEVHTLGSDENTLHILSNDPATPDAVVHLGGFATCIFP